MAMVGSLSIIAAKEAGIGPFDSSLPASLPAPTRLAQINAAHGWTIHSQEWMKTNGVTFSVASSKVANCQLQVELAFDGAAPDAHVSATKSVGRPGDTPHLTILNLKDGTYRWWARFYNGTAVSPWVSFSPATAFGIDTKPPKTPAITSSSYPKPSVVYRSAKGAFAWSATDATSGIRGFWYQLLPQGATVPRTFHVMTTHMTAHLASLTTGSYTFAVAAKSKAGIWSQAGTYAVKLDTTPPSVIRYGFSTFDFNPSFNSMDFLLRIDRPANVRIGIYSASTGSRVRLVTMQTTHRNQLLQYWWHGRDGQDSIVAPGEYTFAVRTTDAFGNTSLITIPNLEVTNKRVIVSLSQQRLWAYEGGHLANSSLVTTGNVHELPTPAGHFTILDMRHPFTFVSESPPNSQYWYPSSPVAYAMLFKKGGYYIHDAPWRTTFGPGTNTQPGIPGSPDTGTHGCVNVPASMAAWLYSWLKIGVPVIVQA